MDSVGVIASYRVPVAGAGGGKSGAKRFKIGREVLLESTEGRH